MSQRRSLDRGSVFGTPTLLVGVFVLASAGCRPTHPPSAGCGKDTDCKGDRICAEGSCVAPAADAEASEAVAEPVPVAPASAGQGERWFRGGPGHAGATTAVGPKTEPSERWRVDLGAVVFATPTLVTLPGAGGEGDAGRELAFVGNHAGRFVGVTVGGPEQPGGELVFDLDLGGRVWGTAALAETRDSARLYVGTDADTLFALDPSAKGEAAVVWSKVLGNCENTRSPGPEGARCDVDGGPTVGPDGDLFVGADGVYRLSPTGEERWHWPPREEKERPKHVFSTPVLSADGQLSFGDQDGHVTSLDAATGAQRWRYSVRADVDGSGVLGADGALFIGADDGRIYSLRSDGSLRWSFVAQRDIRSSLGIAADGTVYATSFDANLYSLAASGEVNWVLPTGGVVHSSPVVDGDGTIYFGSQDDHLYAVSAEGEVLWAVDVGADIDSSVAITKQGWIVIGCDDGSLRAFG
ncbi:PQQ-binding-like beta-propeller repeat protein [Plesiocystis pacifica]|uniref:outer membrane protein assembly factor BamB family protein n=1 Tax=Plesiocystis pacifica TaxID=191768 RepID=UPI0012FB6B6A|nr:PQQ-binding-like beta-propeller repeat protein [Plesiocystis pacifica]